ncbi:MAG: STY4851/ECs_5259 family protein [Rhizobiaceae bacterium]|nr:STY4851/ECs_5259 family protein [Rhizobiaceae bacterium]
MLLKAIVRRRKLVDGKQSGQDGWLSEYDLPAVDGRALYLYRLSDDAFGALRSELRGKRAMLAGPATGALAGKFVLWASEWFRRHYDGTQRNWSDLGQPVGLTMPQADWRRLADDGLRYWRIAPLKVNGTHHRLAAIARQGGFPVAALEGSASGWAKAFLERVVSVLLSRETCTADIADTVCEDLLHLVPQTWRSKEIRLVSGELAVQIVLLRRNAERAGVPSGSLVSLWLDETYRDWRNDLPVSIGSAAGKALIDGLFLAEAARPAASIRARRLLLLGPGGARREMVELQLSGSIQDAGGSPVLAGLLGDWNRLRLYASEALARHVSGELAVADPDSDGRWLCRPTAARIRYDVPSHVAISLEMRGGGSRVGNPFVLPGGERLPGDLRIYEAIDDAPGEVPRTLRLIGTGSRAYSPDRLYIDAPREWHCAASDLGSRCARIAGLPDERRALWLVQGAAIVTSPRQDRYLVRGGQKGDLRDELVLAGQTPSGFRAVDPDQMLIVGEPDFRLRRGSREWTAIQEIWWRRPGENRWQPAQRRTGHGPFEFAWLDPATHHVRDRRDAIILPEQFRVARRRTETLTELSVAGWDGEVRLDAGRHVDRGIWQLDRKDIARSTARARLTDGFGRACELDIPLPHPPWIATWSGGPLPNRESLSHSEINRFVATADGREELTAVLLDHQDRAVPGAVAYWQFEDELPLSTIADDLAALLHGLGDLGAKVRLGFTHGSIDVWFLRPYECRLSQRSQHWAPDRVPNDAHVRIAGRSLGRPACEVDLGPYERTDGEMPAPIVLPPLAGEWLVYLRTGGRILSTPLVVKGHLPPEGADTPFAQAMMVADRTARLEQLGRICDEMLAAPATECRAFVQSVIEIALSLDGLPSSTFDVLTLVSSRPRLATRMLFQVGEEQLPKLYRLSDGLPFAWEMLPAAAWDEAGRQEMQHLLRLVPNGEDYIMPIISQRIRRIATDLPALGPVLGFTAPCAALKDAANDFVTRADGRIDPDPSPFRPALANALPAWNVPERYWRALDAPVAAARAARERVTLSPAQVICVKTISRRHPKWFCDGFAAAFSDQARR